MSGESASEAGSGFSFPVMPSPNAAQGSRAEIFSVEHGDRAAAHGGDDDGMSDAGSESTIWSVLADATSQAAQALLDIQSHGSGPRRPGRRSLDAEALENEVFDANKPYSGAFVFPSPSGGY